MTTYPLDTFLDSDRDVGTMKSGWFDPIRDVHLETPGGSIEDAQDIVAGVITPAVGESRAIQVDTQAAAATDELDFITNTNVPVGGYVELRSTNSARVIELTHNTTGAGKMLLRDGVSYFLDDPNKRIEFKRIGTDFEEVWRSHPKLPEPGAEVATTSGASVTLASGVSPNARRITVLLFAVSANATHDLLIQIGDSGGVESAGYTGASASGFVVQTSAAAVDEIYGSVTLDLFDPANHQWISAPVGGEKTLDTVLTSVTLLTTQTFDGGSAAVRIEE